MSVRRNISDGIKRYSLICNLKSIVNRQLLHYLTCKVQLRVRSVAYTSAEAVPWHQIESSTLTESYWLIIGGFGIMHSYGEGHVIHNGDVTNWGGKWNEESSSVWDGFKGKDIIFRFRDRYSLKSSHSSDLQPSCLHGNHEASYFSSCQIVLFAIWVEDCQTKSLSVKPVFIYLLFGWESKPYLWPSSTTTSHTTDIMVVMSCIVFDVLAIIFIIISICVIIIFQNRIFCIYITGIVISTAKRCS